MCTGSVYKKFCFALILVGLILCGGRCVYAHGSELTEVINASRKEPTIERLKRLVDLFEEDIEYHQSRGEIMEAKKSKAMVVSTKVEIAIRVHYELTEEDYKKIITLLELESTLWNDAGDTKRAKYSLLRASGFKAIGAFYRARENSTIENWTETAKLYGETFKACMRAGDLIFARVCMKRVAYADKMIINLGGVPVGPPTNYEYAILTNDL